MSQSIKTRPNKILDILQINRIFFFSEKQNELEKIFSTFNNFLLYLEIDIMFETIKFLPDFIFFLYRCSCCPEKVQIIIMVLTYLYLKKYLDLTS